MAGSCAVVPGTACSSFQEPGCAERTLSSKYPGLVLWSFVAAPDDRGEDRVVAMILHLTHCCRPLSGWSDFMECKRLGPPDSWSFIFLFSPFGSQTLKTKQFCIWGKVESDHIYLREGTGSEKTLSFIPQDGYAVQRSHNNKQTNKTKHTHQTQQTLGKRENLIPELTKLLDSNVLFSTKNHKADILKLL